jgi:hypothetical protein
MNESEKGFDEPLAYGSMKQVKEISTGERNAKFDTENRSALFSWRGRLSGFAGVKVAMSGSNPSGTAVPNGS